MRVKMTILLLLKRDTRPAKRATGTGTVGARVLDGGITAWRSFMTKLKKIKSFFLTKAYNEGQREVKIVGMGVRLSISIWRLSLTAGAFDGGQELDF